MKQQWIVYFALLHVEHWNIYGQNAACSKDERKLDTCDGRKVSDNNIYIDFGEIEYQCSCFISLNISGQTFYTLAKNPAYENCGTAVKITDSYNERYRLPCTTSPNTVVLTNRSSFVELINGIFDGPTGYCLRVFTNDKSKVITGSCGLSKSTIADTRLTSTVGRDQSTDGGVGKSTTTFGNQTVDVLTTEYFIYTSDVNTKGSTLGSTGNGLRIGLVTGGILVSVSTGVIFCLVIYIVRFRKRKSTIKNEKNKAENPEPAVTLTPLQNRPTSAYTTLNPGEANDPGEQPYTVPLQNRPTSAYTTLNPGEANDPGEQHYTVPLQNRPYTAYTTLNPGEANDPGEQHYTVPVHKRPGSAYTSLIPDEANDPGAQQYTGLNLKIMPKITEIKCSTRPNSTYTALNPEQELDNAENLYSGLN